MPQRPWFKHVGEHERAHYARELEVMNQYISEVTESPETAFKRTSLGRELLSCRREKHVVLARALFAAIGACGQTQDEQTHEIFLEALAALLRRKIEFTQSDLTSLLMLLTTMKSIASRKRFLRGALETIQRVVGWRDLTTEERHLLLTLRGQLWQTDKEGQASTAKFVNQIDQLCNEWVSARLHPDEGWAD